MVCWCSREWRHDCQFELPALGISGNSRPEVDCRDSLDQADWQQLADNLAFTNSSGSPTNQPRNTRQRFYRVLEK